MPKTTNYFLALFFLFLIKGWSDILPDPNKYHRYSTEVIVDNISKYPKYQFVILYPLYFDGYPKIIFLDSSGVVPLSPKWTQIYILAIQKGILDDLDEDEIASDLLEFIKDREYKPFPVGTYNNLFIENKYPINKEKFYYKIVSIKDSKAKLKLHRRVVEFLDGTKKIVRIK